MRDPLCPLGHVYSDATGEPCPCCAALSRARAETLEACAKVVAMFPMDPDVDGDFVSRVGVWTAIRSLSPSAAAPTHTPASGGRCPTCKSKRGYRSGPICLGANPDPWHDTPADAGRE